MHTWCDLSSDRFISSSSSSYNSLTALITDISATTHTTPLQAIIQLPYKHSYNSLTTTHTTLPYNSLTTIHTTLPYKHHNTRLCEPPMAVGSRGGAGTMEIVERVTPAGSTRAFRKLYLLFEV